MSALLSNKQDIENLIQEYRFYASLNFNSDLYPAVAIEDLILEECE